MLFTLLESIYTFSSANSQLVISYLILLKTSSRYYKQISQKVAADTQK